MNTRWMILALGLALTAVGCSESNSFGESDLTESDIDTFEESDATPTVEDTASPKMRTQGGFWGDGYHEEEVDPNDP